MKIFNEVYYAHSTWFKKDYKITKFILIFSLMIGFNNSLYDGVLYGICASLICFVLLSLGYYLD